MTEDSYKLLEWGLEEESCLQIKSQSLGTVVQFREKEFLVLGQKEITRFESTLVKESYSYVLTALVPVPKYDILIGVTAVSAEFIILFMSDLKRNIMTGVKVNDQSVFNIIYSTNSDTIITSGEHLITWSFKYIPSETSVVFTYPTVKISMKKIILSHIHSSIMNPPMFDSTREELYINDNKGNIQSYNLNGISNGTAIKYDSTSQTACGFNSETQYFMTTNANQGAVLWPKSAGGINKRFFIGTSASLAIQFLDDEYVAILDAKYMITIIDIKTSNFFNCYQSNFPVHRMFYFQNPYPRIVLCAGSTVILLKVNLPWRFWNPTFGKPLSITRSNKKNEAARITVVLENSHVRLISPKTGSILTAATLTSLATPITCFYDRGTTEQHNNINTKRDQLLIPLIDGPMEIFSTGQDPCQMIGKIEIKITSICECKFHDEWSFCFGTNVGQLLFYSYNTMKMIGRIVCYHKYPIIGTFYDRESECLILAFKNQSVLLSLQQEKEVGDYMHINCSRVSLFFDRILIFAGEKGIIESLYVLNKQILRHETNLMRLHDDSITSFSLGSSFFITSSIDKTVKVWSKEFHVLCKLVFPLPILQCCAMNGKRDILLATLNDIMIVKGSDVFGDYIDFEDEVYDNYDRKTDFLDNSFLMFADEEEEKEGSVFEGRKKKNEPKKTKVNARRKRIIEALKKQMMMMENNNAQFDDQNVNIENKQKNIVNLPTNENNLIAQKKPENLTQKDDRKSENESYYEYVPEEEEDRKSHALRPISSKKSQNLKNEQKDNKNDEKIDKSQMINNEEEEIERKKKLLEKQKADKEKEEKEKEILKIYNDAKHAKEIKEPTLNSKPRPARQKPLKPKQMQPSNEDLEETCTNNNNNKNDNDDNFAKETENEDEKQENIAKSKQNNNSKTKKNNKTKTNNDETNQAEAKSNSTEGENNKKAEKEKGKTKKAKTEKNPKKTKIKTKESENGSQNQDENENSNQKQKDKEKKKTKTTTKDKPNEIIKDSKNNKNKENEKDQNNNKTTSKIKDNEITQENTNQNNNKTISKIKDNEITQENANQNSIIKENDKDKNKSNEKANKTNKTQEKSTQNKESENQKKIKTQQTTTTIKKSQSTNLKKGYKNASSQTIDPSSLKKVANIPKTVPSNIAIIPQIAKARRVRRSPTPPTNQPPRERRPLFNPGVARKRSRTPDPLRFLVDGSAPPVNLFFDINMVKKMVENGDNRYAQILQLLERQGLKSNKLPTLPLQPQKNTSPARNLRRGMVNNNSPSSWGVMVTLQPIKVSQIKTKSKNESNDILSESIEDNNNNNNSENKGKENDLNLNDNKIESEKNDVDDKNATERIYTNQGKNSGIKINKMNDFSDKLSDNELSFDLYNKPSVLYDNQLLSMKKAQKTSNKSRGSSVPNVNKTIAEIKFCKEQLMQKIREKRAKESQNDENESQTSSSFQLESELTAETTKTTDQSLSLNEIINSNSNNKVEQEISDFTFQQKENETFLNNENKKENQDKNKNNQQNNIDNDDSIENQTSLPLNKANDNARFASINLNPKLPNQITQNPSSARIQTFVEPIMPIYLRASKDIRYIKQDGISPFACKRYRMIVDSNGPKDAKNFPSHRTGSKSVNNSQNNNDNNIISRKALIDQYVKSPGQLLKPLQLMKTQTKY